MKENTKNNNIKISLIELKNAESSLGKILNSTMDVKTSYWLSKVARKVRVELKRIDDIRVALVEILGEKDEKGGIKVPDAKMEEFYKSYQKALEEVIEFNFPKIKIGLLSQVKLSPNDIINLDAFIEVDDGFLKSISEDVK